MRTKNLDIKNIKYLLKIKNNTEYVDYEVSKTNILIDEYKSNIDYEVKVRVLINDLYGDWSEITKFKIQPKNQNNFVGLFGNNNQGGSLFDNKSNIFSNNDIKGPSIFDNNKNVTGGVFGNNKNIFSNNDIKGPGIFVNNNQVSGGVFAKNRINGIFGINIQSGGIFGNQNQ